MMVHWLMVAALALTLASAPACAETWPSRPIRLIVPTGAGGAQDIAARLLQPHLEKALGQPVVVDNRSGASTILGTDAAAKAAPDGHTLVVVPSTFTVNAALLPKLPFDAERDFAAVALIGTNPLLLVVNPKLPARTLGEFLALAKAAPGTYNYATPGASTQAHLLMEMLSARAGVKLQHIPYRGGAATVLGTVTGDAHIALMSPLAVAGQIAAGTVRPIGVGGNARDPQFPDLPTRADAGFGDLEAVQWLGLLTTAGTPADVVARLNAEVNKALRDPDLVAKLAAQGVAAAGGTSEEFRAQIAREIRDWRAIAKAADIKPE